MPQLFDAALLDRLSAAARANPRRRQHHNLHTSPQDPAQRFLNAIEPGSYVAPHRHADRDETLVLLRGRLGLILFDAAGQITATHLLAPGAALGFVLQAGVWHGVVALEEGTVFFETKAGPYNPATAAEFAAWAPATGSDAATALEQGLRALFHA